LQCDTTVTATPTKSTETNSTECGAESALEEKRQEPIRKKKKQWDNWRHSKHRLPPGSTETNSTECGAESAPGERGKSPSGEKKQWDNWKKSKHHSRQQDRVLAVDCGRRRPVPPLTARKSVVSEGLKQVALQHGRSNRHKPSTSSLLNEPVQCRQSSCWQCV